MAVALESGQRVNCRGEWLYVNIVISYWWNFQSVGSSFF